MDGAMMEVGPYRVRDGGKLEYNNGSWDEFANLLFVDQPVGTGFSYVNTDSYLTDLNQMVDHMMIFLEKWFALFPEYEHDDVSCTGFEVCVATDRNSSTSPASPTLDSTFHTLPVRSSTETRTRPCGSGTSKASSSETAGCHQSTNILRTYPSHTRTA
jgi:hypothetical protein